MTNDLTTEVWFPNEQAIRDEPAGVMRPLFMLDRHEADGRIVRKIIRDFWSSFGNDDRNEARYVCF